MGDSTAREEMDWALYGRGVRELAQMVADDGYRPDMILAIARGGLFCAGSLGYALSVKNTTPASASASRSRWCCPPSSTWSTTAGPRS